jgi:drug/metabolite transporter (DMT)-like permease
VGFEPPASRRLGENLRGAGFMVLMAAGFSSNDTFMKVVSADLPLFQAVFLRGLIATVLLAGMAAAQGALRVRLGRRDRRLIATRCLAEIGATVCFLTALFNMPIANATAILQSIPLAVTLAAALVYQEPVGWGRYLAIAIGFLGVLVLIRPGPEGFDLFALWAVAALVFIVVRDLSTRQLSPDTPGTTVALLTSAVLTVFAGTALLWSDWAPVEAAHLARLGGAACCLIVGYVCGVRAMRSGEIGFVQPFRYTLLLWAMLFGILVFGEWPDAWMLLGSAIVVGTRLFTLYRERQLAGGSGPGGG